MKTAAHLPVLNWQPNSDLDRFPHPQGTDMKALAVIPKKKNSIHLRDDVPMPSLDDVPNGRGVLIRTLQVGVDATDREINDALYGAAPPGFDYLVIGHEFFGQVVEVGEAVTKVQPGDYVAVTVRRNGTSIHDKIGYSDITDEEVYFERGINLLHGYLTEFIVDDMEFVVKVPAGLRHLGVLSEPMSVAAKSVQQAFEAQRRLLIWEPKIAYVLGAGQIGLLATLILRLKGIEVHTFARTPKPALKAEITEDLGATYHSLKEVTLQEAAAQTGKPDLIIEATGSSTVAFDSMSILNINGVLVWTSITGGDNETTVPADKFNLEWVLGNKLLLGSVNGNWRHFQMGITDLSVGEQMYPGVLSKILTSPVDGLENYEEMLRLLTEDKQALKVFMNVAEPEE